MTARVAMLVGAAAYAGVLATTEPFTATADLVTAAGLAVGAGVAFGAWGAFGRPPARRPAPLGEDHPDHPVPVGEATTGTTTVPWLVLLAVVVGWELYCYFGGPRPAHPTLSSVYDVVARWPAAKAVVVLAWLALGWGLLRR